jgi:hypothetical protein
MRPTHLSTLQPASQTPSSIAKPSSILEQTLSGIEAIGVPLDLINVAIEHIPFDGLLETPQAATAVAPVPRG